MPVAIDKGLLDEIKKAIMDDADKNCTVIPEHRAMAYAVCAVNVFQKRMVNINIKGKKHAN